MSLSDGDLAADGDIWFRIITNEKYIVKGRVHHSAFRGKAISRPTPAKNRPWTRELSGRLRSRAGSLEDIERDAIAFCERETARGGGTKTFCGVIYARAANIKRAHRTILITGVNFTPIEPDNPAHADLTFYACWLANESRDQREREHCVLWLCERLIGLHCPAQLRLLPDAHISPISAASQLKNFATSFITRIRQTFSF